MKDLFVDGLVGCWVMAMFCVFAPVVYAIVFGVLY